MNGYMCVLLVFTKTHLKIERKWKIPIKRKKQKGTISGGKNKRTKRRRKYMKMENEG